MRDSTSYADPGLKMRDTFAVATVLTLKSDPRLPSHFFYSQYRVPYSQSNLKVSTDLGYCKVFNLFYNLNCSA
jgi:hypothetical protein